ALSRPDRRAVDRADPARGARRRSGRTGGRRRTWSSTPSLRGVAWRMARPHSVGGMARSTLTLAAAASAALGAVAIPRVRGLTAGGGGRCDAARVTADGEDIVVRVPTDETVLADVDSELVALRALTTGARKVLGFAAPEIRGSASLDDTRVVATSFLPGYLV